MMMIQISSRFQVKITKLHKQRGGKVRWYPQLEFGLKIQDRLYLYGSQKKRERFSSQTYPDQYPISSFCGGMSRKILELLKLIWYLQL